MEVDGRDESLQISMAGSSSFEGHDFAAEPLGDGIGVCVENVVQAFVDQLGDLFDRFQSAEDGPRIPAVEEHTSGNGLRHHATGRGGVH